MHLNEECRTEGLLKLPSLHFLQVGINRAGLSTIESTLRIPVPERSASKTTASNLDLG